MDPDADVAATADGASLYEHVGSQDGLHRLVAAWYPTVLLGGFPALLKPHRDKRTRDTLRGYLERHPRRRPELPRHR